MRCLVYARDQLADNEIECDQNYQRDEESALFTLHQSTIQCEIDCRCADDTE